MTTKSLYKEILLDHFRRPRNKGVLANANLMARGRNPRCGDDLQIEVKLAENCLEQVMFTGRGCSVCVASASMMTAEVMGKSLSSAKELCLTMGNLFGDGAEQNENHEKKLSGEKLPGDLDVLSAVSGVPARRRCVLLSWQALSDALSFSDDSSLSDTFTLSDVRENSHVD